jgi:hypothetical protein
VAGCGQAEGLIPMQGGRDWMRPEGDWCCWEMFGSVGYPACGYECCCCCEDWFLGSFVATALRTWSGVGPAAFVAWFCCCGSVH